MKRKFFQRVLLIAGIFAFVSGYSDDNCEEDYKGTYQGHAASKDQMTKGYNHPARIDVKGSWDYYISGSFIWWQPRQDGLEFARNVQDPNEDGTILHNRLVHMDFDFHPGFKVGMGSNFERDNWSLDFEYTRLYTKDSHSRTLPIDTIAANYLFPFWVNFSDFDIPGSEFWYSRATWKLHFNILDASLARAYYVGTKLTFKPYVGLRAGWVHQKYHTFEHLDVIYNLYTSSHSKSQSWLLGARLGLDTDWHLGSGFRFFGNTAGSLFYQRFHTEVNLDYPIQEEVLVQTLYTTKEDKGYFNPNVETILGFGWGDYFYDDSWHIDLLAQYEFHIFWDQNMMRKMLDYTFYRADPTPGDLVLHGLTISLALDF